MKKHAEKIKHCLSILCQKLVREKGQSEKKIEKANKNIPDFLTWG